MRRAGERGRPPGEAGRRRAPGPPRGLAPPAMRATAGSLADRDLEVARLRALIRRVEGAPPARARRLPGPTLSLESVATPHGVALRHVTQVSMREAVGEEGPSAPGTLYLDTETTGLAGG